MANNKLEELIVLYREFDEAGIDSAAAAFESFETACRVQAQASNIDPIKLQAFVRKRYLEQIKGRNRRKGR